MSTSGMDRASDRPGRNGRRRASVEPTDLSPRKRFTDTVPQPTGNEATTPSPKGDVPPWLRSAGLSAWFIIGIGIVVAALVAGTIRIIPVFVAVFVALVFTALLNPIVGMLSRYISRWIAVIISILGSFAFFSGLLALVITSVAGQWQSLAEQLSHGVDMIIDFLDSMPFHITLTSDEVYTWIVDLTNRGQDYITTNWQTLAKEALSNVGSIAIFFTIVALSVFVTVFFLHSGSSMWRWFLNLLPAKSRGATNLAARAGWLSFSGYARGTVIIAVADGAMAWVFLEIIRVPLAPALGILVMIGAFIPMVGAPAAMVVAMIVALAVDGIWKALAVGIGIALIGQLEGHILQPLIMGRQVSLHPVVVGIGVVAGTLLGGLLGAIVVIPILGVVWAMFSALYHRDPPIEGDLPDPPQPRRSEPPQLPRIIRHRA